MRVPFSGVGHNPGPNAALGVRAMTLQEAHHGHLANAPAPLDLSRPFALVHEAGPSTDKGFIDFDVAATHFVKGLRLNRQTQPVQHEPCGFLGDADVARNFVAAHAVLAVDEQPHGGQPPRQGNRAVLEDAPNLDAELLPAVFALPDTARFDVGRIDRIAVRATDAIGPAQAGDEAGRYVHVCEVGNCAKEGVWGAVLGGHKPMVSAYV